MRLALATGCALVLVSFANPARSRSSGPAPPASPPDFACGLRGLREEPPDDSTRAWTDRDGDILVYQQGGPTDELPDLSDAKAVRGWSRSLARSQGGGLIEVRGAEPSGDGALRLIYKHVEAGTHVYTGLCLVPHQDGPELWIMIAREHGAIGVRESLVTAELLRSGRFRSRADLERVWAQDPYDPDYHVVDRKVLHFISDDEIYDAGFPNHPLSKMRRVLGALPCPILIASPKVRLPETVVDTTNLGRPSRPGDYVYVEELPEAITKVPPTYPPEARRNGVDGTVIVQALVGKDGTVLETRVVKSIPALDDAAAACVRQWRFKPALSKGKPVPVWVAVPVRFTLN